jgi:hypothetical protein
MVYDILVVTASQFAGAKIVFNNPAVMYFVISVNNRFSGSGVIQYDLVMSALLKLSGL